jgi:hypothetical protein
MVAPDGQLSAVQEFSGKVSLEPSFEGSRPLRSGPPNLRDVGLSLLQRPTRTVTVAEARSSRRAF